MWAYLGYACVVPNIGWVGNMEAWDFMIWGPSTVQLSNAGQVEVEVITTLFSTKVMVSSVGVYALKSNLLACYK